MFNYKVWTIAFLLFANPCWALGPKDAFNAGIQNFRSEKYKDAETQFKSALTQSPDSISTLYNLALTEAKLGQNGLALALLRRALYIEPSYRPAIQARDLLANQVQAPAIARELTNWEWLHASLLSPVSLSEYLFVLALLVLIVGGIAVRYLGQRHRALQEEKPIPAPPVLGLLLALVLIFSLALALAKVVDILSPRGTIITKAEVKTGPSADSTTLFEIPEGNEVLLKDSADMWVQITYPGSITGWVKKDSVLPASGELKW